MLLSSLFPAGKYIHVSFISFSSWKVHSCFFHFFFRLESTFMFLSFLFRLESTLMFLLSLFPAGKYINVSFVTFSGRKVQLLLSCVFFRLESILMSLSSVFPTGKYFWFFSLFCQLKSTACRVLIINTMTDLQAHRLLR